MNEENSKLVSVIIPAYKKKYFYEAISSVLNQTYKNIELIIVNDKSPEDLTSVVNCFNDSRIHYYLNEHNIGGKDPVSNWNKCLSYTNGEFVSLLCDDDMYETEFIMEMVTLANTYKTCDVFRSRCKIVNCNNNIVNLYPTTAKWLSGEDFISHFLTGRIHLTISEWFFRRSRILECGGYFSAPLAWYSDDLSIFRFAARHGVVTSPKILVTFRQSGINISSHTIKNRLGMLKAIIVFDDAVKFLIDTSDFKRKELLLNELKLFVNQCRMSDVRRLRPWQYLRVLFHKKEYGVSSLDLFRYFLLFPETYIEKKINS